MSSAKIVPITANKLLMYVILHTLNQRISVKKLMKWKDLRKQSLQGKTAASVVLKLFICGNERCHTTDTPSARAELHKQHTKNTIPIYLRV